MNEFKPGDKVQISANVYKFKWEGYDYLQHTFGFWHLTVDRIVDLRDVHEGVWIIIAYNGIKAKVRPNYIFKLENA